MAGEGRECASIKAVVLAAQVKLTHCEVARTWHVETSPSR